jgi:hypothetical protein
LGQRVALSNALLVVQIHQNRRRKHIDLSISRDHLVQPKLIKELP